MELFVLRLERGGPWDWSRDMREQDGWDEHAKFMDDLVDEGFILLGGPLEGDRETMHHRRRAVRGGDSGAVRHRSVVGERDAPAGAHRALGDRAGRPWLSSIRVTTAANPAEAETIRGLLQTEGIESVRRQTDFGAGTMDGFSGGQTGDPRSRARIWTRPARSSKAARLEEWREARMS